MAGLTLFAAVAAMAAACRPVAERNADLRLFKNDNLVIHDLSHADIRVWDRAAFCVRQWRIYVRQEDMFSGDDRILFQRRGLYGFMDARTGRTVVRPVYKNAWRFSDGRAAVYKDGKIGFVNGAGDLVIDFRYPYTSNIGVDPVFSNGRCVIASGDDMFGVIDTLGNWCIEPVHSWIAMQDDYAIVHGKDYRYMIGYDGTFIRDLIDYVSEITWTENITSYDSGGDSYRTAEVEHRTGYYEYFVGDFCGLMDPEGRKILPPRYLCIRYLADGMFRLTLPDESSEIIFDSRSGCML